MTDHMADSLYRYRGMQASFIMKDQINQHQYRGRRSQADPGDPQRRRGTSRTTARTSREPDHGRQCTTVLTRVCWNPGIAGPWNDWNCRIQKEKNKVRA